MPDKKPRDAKRSAELRRKAEELAAYSEIGDPVGAVRDDMKELIHELEVHQLELELQNEEMRRAQQELQASKDRYSDLFDFAPVGYLTLDKYFQIVDANFTASRILDVERRDLFHKKLTQCIARKHQDLFYQFAKINGPREGNTCELAMHRKDGTPFFAELKIREDPASDTNFRYRVALIDITERKRMQDEVKRSRDELEFRVKERTEQLQRVTGQLALAEQRERQRLSKILHDGLQQILVAAKFRLAFIAQNAGIKQATNQVEEIIDDALEISRSLTAELSPPVLGTGDTVSALEWLAHWMQDKQGLEVNLISHQKIGPLKIDANLLLFHSVRELLFNVVKHSGVKSARVDVEQSGGEILLRIEDEGVGFDVSQLGNKERKSGGVGLLGVQERISYLGGRLEIDSAPGRGSRFKLVIPLSTLARVTKSATREDKDTRISIMIAQELDFLQTGGERKIRIMLADDHMVMRQGLASLLRGEPDFEIVGEASDGESAVKLARDIRPDVLLMDISMPKMDGIQATRIIHRELRDTRIIGLSMFQEPEREAAIREAGAVGYLSKSGPADAIIAAIRAYTSST